MSYRYLKIQVSIATEEQMDETVEVISSVVEQDPYVDEDGDAYLHVQSDMQLMADAFCLGIAYEALEAEGHEVPFTIEVVELDEPLEELDPSVIVNTEQVLLH